MNKKIERFLKRKQVINVLGENYSLSELQETRLLNFFYHYGHEKKCEEWFRTLSYMIKYDLSNYVGRIRRLKRLPASPNNYSLMLRYGKFWKQHKSVAASNRTLHYPNRIDYWINLGYSSDEALEKVCEIQTNRSRRSPVSIGGTSEYSCRSVLFWIKQGLSEKQAKQEVARIQQRKKTPDTIAKWLITLHNKTDEEKQQISLKKGHSVNSYMARGFSEEESIQMSNAYYAKRNNFSKSSQAFFMILENFFNKDRIFYKCKNYEKQFFGKCVDFYDADSKTVVEFYGDFWHRNPAKFESTQRFYNNTSEEIWNKDKIRLEKISTHPEVKKIIVVWESEVLVNPHNAALKIIQEIKDGK